MTLFMTSGWSPRIVLVVALAPVLSGATELRILTHPDGAEVWQGPVRLGVTSPDGFTLADVAPGTLTLVIKKDGFQPVSRKIEIPAGGEPITIEVQLRAISDSAAPVSGERPARRKGKGLLIGGIVAGVAAGGVAVAVLTKDPDPLDVDDDHDGFSENAGDCNDADAQVNPMGQFTVDVRTPLRGTVDCNTPTGTTEVVATNLSCATVSISSVVWNETLGDGGCGGEPFNLEMRLAATGVIAGGRNVTIASQFYGGTIGCCFEGDCGPVASACTFNGVFTVSTGIGQRTASASYNLVFPAGLSCSVCPERAARPVVLQSVNPRR